MLANLTVNHPNISVWVIHEQNELEDSSSLIILTQSCVMTACIEMKSSESEAPLIGDMVKAKN